VRLPAVRKFLRAAGKSAVFACSVAVAVSACAHQDVAVNSTEPDSGITADSLILGVDDVRRIAGFAGLTSEPALDLRQPGHSDSGAPAPCRIVFDQEVTFDGGWTQFRSVTYNGENNAGPAPVINGVAQAVGIYPDDAAAHTAFDRLVPALTACSTLHARYYDFTVQRRDPSTVALCYDQCSSMYRVKSSVLINVEVSQFKQSERIARTVLQNIADRVN
jgi:hypothetical protein